MSLSQNAIDKKTLTNFTMCVILIAGIAAFFGLGKLEDPVFTVKVAVVTTVYPGATAEEVELEVTDRIEKVIQEMPQVKEIESFSRAGMSLVKVFIHANIPSDQLPQVWDELRKKIGDAAGSLPPGVNRPIVGDDFGDVFGFLVAVVGDGFNNSALESQVDGLKKELSLVPGVAKVSLWGVQTQCIYVDVDPVSIARLGVTSEEVYNTLTKQNVVVNGGGFEILGQRMRFETTGEFQSPEDIGSLLVKGHSNGSHTQFLRISDIAKVSRGYIEPKQAIMRYNGAPAIAMAISNTMGTNIIHLGQDLEAKINELKHDLPVGIEISKISWQEDSVSESIETFMISLIQAVLIVLVVLWIAMGGSMGWGAGFRVAIIVGISGLIYVIIASLLFMKFFDINLQRMSLGALVIAMGMMVDNAIVVVDGIIVLMQKGEDRIKAAIKAATLPSIPLLGATIIAVLTFYPIAASDEGAGEYCASLFSVVGIALMISWILSVTVTPVMCIALLPEIKASAEGSDPYDTTFYKRFTRFLNWSIRCRWLVVMIFIGMLVGAVVGFKNVDQMFFPSSARPQLMVDYWVPEGTSINNTSLNMKVIEDKLCEHPAIESVSTFIGKGPPRFYLPVESELPYESYGQFIVNVYDYHNVPKIIAELEPWIAKNVPEAMVLMKKYGLGPSETWPVDVRISGGAIADAKVLRSLAKQVQDIYQASPYCKESRTNWRQRVKKVVSEYDQINGRWTGINRDRIASATRMASDGLPVGQFREQDKLLPIMMRYNEEKRTNLAGALGTLPLRQPMSTVTVPLMQVTRDIKIAWEDPLIWRFNRRRCINIQAIPTGLTAEFRDDVKEKIEAIKLPPGYELMWDGEYRSSSEAQASLIPGMIPAFLVIAIIIVGLFNAYKPPLIILCVIPFCLIGITFGLLLTGQPFGFVALLGAMSLTGMMIKNAIVLLDQINIEISEGKTPYDAVILSALSRLRPVMLAAGTTVLGVVPLLPDVFWKSMAVTIMFGLAFGSIITMVLIPVLYSCFFKLKVPQKK